jgi:hypothetical protein
MHNRHIHLMSACHNPFFLNRMHVHREMYNFCKCIPEKYNDTQFTNKFLGKLLDESYVHTRNLSLSRDSNAK